MSRVYVKITKWGSHLVAVQWSPSCMRVGVEERIGVRNTIVCLSGVWDGVGRESGEGEG